MVPIGSHSNQTRNLLLPQRIQPKQSSNRFLWQVGHPNRTRNLFPQRRTQRNQTRNLPLR
jgi:hypothetical protein